MDDLYAHGLGKLPGLVHHTFLVRRGNVLALDRDDRTGGDPLYVTPRNAGEHLVHPDSGHPLGILHRAPDGLDRMLHVHHQPSAEAL